MNIRVRVKKDHTRVMPEGGGTHRYVPYVEGEKTEIPEEWFNKNLHKKIMKPRSKKKAGKKSK